LAGSGDAGLPCRPVAVQNRRREDFRAMTIRFDGRVAIVTGAGTGLGRSHALLLAARGARLVVNDIGAALDGGGRSSAAADAVVEEIRAAGGTAVASHDSVAEPDSAARIVAAALDAFGTVDILVNNAGILRDKSFEKMPLADFDLVLKVHLAGAAYVTKAAWPAMKAKNYGRIVMTTSAAGLYGNFGQANYAAAKAGLVGLMLALKEEGLKHNIKVNTLAPIAYTRMLATVMPPALEKKLGLDVPSAAVAFLCGEACPVTGQIVEAGARHFALARMVRGKGVRLADDEPATPEAVAARWPAIADLDGAAPFDNAMMAGGAAFRLDD
jgi:NAD(P)-dependent dehydrogenase (short-subunit alcohol dehydrogenase family)